SAATSENVLVALPACPRFEVRQAVASPDHMRVWIDEGRNDGTTSRTHLETRTPPPGITRTRPDDATVRDRQHGIGDHAQLALSPARPGTALWRGCKLRYAGYQQVNRSPVAVSHSAPS